MKTINVQQAMTGGLKFTFEVLSTVVSDPIRVNSHACG